VGLRLLTRRPTAPPRAKSAPTANKTGVSLPLPVEANDEVPEPVFPELPDEVDADVTGAIVVVVAGIVDVVDAVEVVDVVVELEVVVDEDVVVVVEEGIGSALGVAVQHVMNVWALPGTTALTPVPLAAVA
jgi:hypothetical protein